MRKTDAIGILVWIAIIIAGTLVALGLAE